MNWVYWIFDSTPFVTRNHCSTTGGWSQELTAIYQMVHILIMISYFSIPLSLFGLWQKLRTIKILFKQHVFMVMMFCVFIFSCGLGHLMSVMSIYYAPYRLFIFVDIITAISSIVTAILLPTVIYDTIKYIGDVKNESGKE